MIYVHMAVLLNELFFPKTDPSTGKLLTAFAFCSTFFFRPFGALIFGYIGDKVGRRITVIITTGLMAGSCLVMANLSTYAEIGITASWIVTICRIVQGMSSMGEIVGAEIYLMEMARPPIQYPLVALIGTCSAIGGLAALGVATFSTSFGFNWRFAFWFGSGIALVGSIARNALREAPEFADAKRRIKKIFEDAKQDVNILKDDPIVQEKVNKKTSIAVFFIQCSWPICFYFIYVYCTNILRNSFGFSAAEVIHHNFIIAVAQLLGFCSLTILSYYIHPLKILKTIFIISSMFMLVCPYILSVIRNPFELLLLQSFVTIFWAGELPAGPILYKHLPIFKRFTYAAFTFALARALMYAVTSFGLSYLTEKFGYYGLLIVVVPVYIAYAFGLNHYKNLEVEAGTYNQTAAA
jgi:MFS transporter, MHS family, proline/betaine transporter